MLWFIIILFLVMDIVFFMGKGGFLIAGYNTASTKQKAAYDEKKLCRVMGAGMSVVTLSLLIAQFDDELAVPSILGGVFISLVIIFVGGFTYAKKNDFERIETQENKEKKKWYKNPQIYAIIISGVVCVGVAIALFAGDVTIQFNDHSLKATAFLTSSTSVEYDDIEKVDLKENIDTGSRTWGTRSFQIVAGAFKNDEYGKYKLYAYAHCHSYVILSTKNGHVVLNDSSTEKTKELYEKILKVLK